MNELKSRRPLRVDRSFQASREELSADSESNTDDYSDMEDHHVTQFNPSQKSATSNNSLDLSKGTPKPSSSTPTRHKSTEKSFSSYLVYLVIALCIVIFPFFCLPQLGNKKDGLIYPDNSCIFTLPLEDNTKVAIQSAVLETKHNHLSVLLFIHSARSISDQTHNFNNIESIIKYAACELNNNGEYVELTSEILNSKEMLADRGRIITQFKPQLAKQHILVVRHVQDVPSEIAPLFHLLCDRYTPIIAKLLVVFTLEHENSKIFRNMSDFDIVEKVLMDSWFERIGTDNFDPLIARITAQIIRL